MSNWELSSNPRFAGVKGPVVLAILDGVVIDYYGQSTPLNQMAKLSVPEPAMIAVQPFDPAMIGDIERQIQSAGLGLNPSNDGKMIRIPIPPLTEERRKQLARRVGQIAEEGRSSVRHVRRESNDEIKTSEKSGDVSQDDAHRALERIQSLTDEHVKKIDELAKAKEQELLEF